MRKKTFIHLLILFFMYTNSILGQENYDKNLNTFNLKGPVKSIEETSFHIIKKSDLGDEVAISEVVKLSFNKKGNLIETVKHGFKFGEIDGLQTRTYKYDKNDKLVEEMVRYSNRIIKWIYKRDKNGRLVEMSGPLDQNSKYETKIDVKRTYSYDKGGNPTEEKRYRLSEQGDKLLLNNITKYDQDGNETATIRYNRDGSIFKTESSFEKVNKGNTEVVYERYSSSGDLGSRTISEYSKNKILHKRKKYNDLGQLKREEVYYKNSKQLREEKIYSSTANHIQSIHTYDKSGNIITEKQYEDFTGKFRYKSINKYTYDRQGNWILKKKKTKKNLYDRLFHSANPFKWYVDSEHIKRKIEYFE